MQAFQNLSFRGKILATVGVACIICGGISVGVAIHYKDVEFYNGLIEKSRIIHGRLEVAAKYVATQGGLSAIIEKYSKKYTDPSQITSEDKNLILQQVPIFAAMRIGADEAEKDHYSFRVFAKNPRNKDHTPNREEVEILNKFEADPKLKEFVSTSGGFVTVYRPIHLSEKQSCLTCHGAKSTSVWKNGKDILGYELEEWADGRLVGVFAVSNNVEQVLKAQAEKGASSSTLWLTLFIFLGALAALGIASIVVKGPVNTLMHIATVLASTEKEVSNTSSKIEETSQTLSQASMEQASSLQETAASLTEISAMIEKAADNATNTAQNSSESEQKAQEGRNAVEQMLTSINEISSSNDAIMGQISSSNQQIAEIVDVIKEIGNKTKVINEIVFQTKLLSFNASVEAARAGEHGKGFAVVAEEVGNLAQMSGNAAKEITTMLDLSIGKVQTIVAESNNKIEPLIDEGKRRVSSGIIVAQDCANILGEIVSNVTKVASLSQDISNASREQAQGVKEINTAIDQLDTVTHQNAKTSVDAANSARDLSTQAQDLKSVVSELQDTLWGQNKTAA